MNSTTPFPFREPNCFRCPSSLYYDKPISIKQHGVVMHFGDHFCMAAKKVKRLRKKDLQVVPSWCPKYKSPREVNIFDFKDMDCFYMHKDMCQYVKTAPTPLPHYYALAHSTTTNLSAKEFLLRSSSETDADLLGIDVPLYAVVEIDDGLFPICFYKTPEGYIYNPMFNTAKARENTYRREDGNE